jgi:thiaminase (transcriptional activator TenA)
MKMTFSESLKNLAEPYIQAEIMKPFLREMLNGTLPLEKYQYYMKVDYPYLFNFSQILALGVYKAENLESMQLLVHLLDGNTREMAHHESNVSKFGITPEELIKQKMGPVKYSYTRHELAIGQKGLLGELLGSLMPCLWGYAEIACRLINQKPVEEDNPYKEWFDFYTSEDFINLGQGAFKLINRLTKNYTKSQLRQIEKSFLTSCYFEVACWDAYYSMEDWSIS